MITADQLVAHAVGDYVLQSDWMASNKTNRSTAALAHVVAYSLPFLFLRPSLAALAVMAGTHFVIDRWRLARYVVWANNWLAPRSSYQPNVPGPSAQSWANCRATGYPSERPAWLAVWLMVIADNCMHVLINGAALKWL